MKRINSAIIAILFFNTVANAGDPIVKTDIRSDDPAQSASRLSDIKRHCHNLLCVGDSASCPELKKRLESVFGKNAKFANSLPSAEEAKEFDALILLDLPDNADPKNSLAKIEALAKGRQVVCGLDVFAKLFPNELALKKKELDGNAIAVENCYFMKGFESGKVLPWRSGKCLVQGKNFPWMAPRIGFKIALRSYSGEIFALEKMLEGGKLLAFDLSSIEGTGTDGFSDLPFSILLEALGSESVDMGIFAAPWQSYESYISELESFCKRNSDILKIEKLAPLSAEGRALRLLSIGDVEKKPLVLFSSCTHGHEWAPAYGIFSWLKNFIAEERAGTIWAKTVLDNIAIAWVPVVSVDGFHATWARDACVPYGPRNVDLLYNYPPFEIWDSFKHWDGRPRGTAPFSEPEAQVMDSIYKRFAPSGELYVDYHECTENDFYIHDEPNIFVDSITPTIESLFKDRYFISQKDALHQVRFTGNVISSGGPINRAYAKKLGFKEAFLVEFFGNNDYSPYHIIARSDASANFAEQVLGSVLGRTEFNYRSEDFDATGTLQEIGQDKVMDLLIIAPDGKSIREKHEIRGGEDFKTRLKAGERLLILKNKILN